MKNEAGFAGQTLSTPTGYSTGEWLKLLADTDKAARAGACPPPVRIHDQSGRHTSTLRYVNGIWQSHSEIVEPLPEPTEPLPPKQSYVYFIGADVGCVKIGEALDPDRRLRTLQSGSPVQLRILATTFGGPVLERDYHRKFAAHRLHGEWFTRCPEIEAEIARLGGVA